ncbi:MAG: pilus assembly protein TadG-related protein [Acidocella sp.]|nr:pilus assembly protein TadG-related protein [Acidocella sp.]
MSGRRAAIALIVGLMTPVLIAFSGLAVDASYWYQQEESVQSASDAAAIAAATAYSKYNTASVTAAAFQPIAQNFAVLAANKATNNQFSLPSSAVTVTQAAITINSTASTKWTASVQIPRASFFSAANGPGLFGIAAGNQGATGSADVVPGASGPACLMSSGTISVTGGGKIDGTNCGIAANGTGTGGCSMFVTGSGEIIGTSVNAAGSCVSSPQYSGYIGTNQSATPAGSTSTASLNTTTADPLSAFNSSNTAPWNPGWTVPTAPTESGSAISPTLGYNKWNQSGVGNCLVAGAYNAGCELYPNYLTGMTNIGVLSLLLNYNTTSGTTFITGGFTGQSNATTVLNGNNYYINGGMNYASDTSLTIGSSTQTTPMTMVVNGGAYLTNGNATMYPGTYYFSGTQSGSSYTGWGLATNISSTVSLQGSTYYVNGGIGFSNGSPQVSLSSGLYELSDYAGNSNSACGIYSCGSTGAFYAGQGTYVFGNTPPSNGTAPAAATYYFDGGLTISGGASSVIFNPGIYYIRNGNLTIGSGPTVTGTGVTFVLEGSGTTGAAFIVNGGANISLSAPTTNCVQPTGTNSYPLSTYVGTAASNSPYDGTDGEGICGIVIYQERGDTAADTVNEGASGTFNGGIYAPNAPLTVSGAGAMNITTTGVPGLEVGTVSDSGSGNITLTETPASGSAGSSSSSTTVVLVN